MVAGGRNVRMNRQQMESRRKKQQIRWKSLLVRVAVLVVIVFCIRNIYARLEEMQMELERLEIQQYGMAQTNADAQSPDKLNDVDYVGSLDTWEVGKPIERTETEVLQRLVELLFFIGVLPVGAEVCLAPCHHGLQDGDKALAEFGK